MRPLSDLHREMLQVGSGITPGLIEQRGYWTAYHASELLALGFSTNQAIVPALVIPIWGCDGDIVSYQIRPDVPRLNKEGKPVRYESLPGQPPRIDVPPAVRHMIGDPATPLWITEGVKKADCGAVRGICCIDILGVWSWRGLNVRGGATELADWDRIAIKGRNVFLAFDSDVMCKHQVLQALRRLAAALRRRGAKAILPVIIPAADGRKVGLDDWFVSGGGLRELQESVDADVLKQQGIIVNNRSLADVGADGLEAIAENNLPPILFRRAGALVRVVTDERGVVKLDDVSPGVLRNTLAAAATWIEARPKGPIEVFPPTDVVSAILAYGDWPKLPPVEAVTKAPVLAPDGSISTLPGYCPASRYYVAAKEEWMKWLGTTDSAINLIFDDVIGDFPFKGESDRAHALALMLLPIVRPTISGPTPLHLFDAPRMGTGKSLLAQLCLMPTAGDQIAATPATRDEEEWRKRITTALQEGRTYVLFDNLSRKLDSDALASVLTGTEWSDRALSTNRNINVPIRCAWVATANNAELSPDILRRTVWCRLDARVERPEDRRGWKHDPISTWVSANRTLIVSALCHLVSLWSENGKPVYSGRYLGSYEEWCKTVGGILQCAGVPGFLGNVDELRQAAGGDDGAWGDFLKRWWESHPTDAVRAGDLLSIFEQEESLAELLGDKGESNRRVRLGHQIKRRVDMVMGGFVIKAETYQNAKRYRVHVADSGGVWSRNPTNPPETPRSDLGSNGGEKEASRGVCGVCGVISHACACVIAHDAPAYGGGGIPPKPHKPPEIAGFEPENGRGVWSANGETPRETPRSDSGGEEIIEEVSI